MMLLESHCLLTVLFDFLFKNIYLMYINVDDEFPSTKSDFERILY